MPIESGKLSDEEGRRKSQSTLHTILKLFGLNTAQNRT